MPSASSSQYALLTGCVIALLLAVVTGCTAGYRQRADALAEAVGASASWVSSGKHRHRVYEKAGTGPVLRVYLGGDGRAFLQRQVVAPDPTPAEHLTLKLMLADPGPAVFVARPCYYGTATEPGCEPRLWTSERYSDEVVASLAQVIHRLAAEHAGMPLQLVGYSGGGVIAVRLAQHLPEAVAVITLAAPLDTGAWTAHHGYTPLAPGQNPAGMASWPGTIRQLHLSGASDDNVPPELQAGYRRRMQSLDPSAVFRTLPDYDHHCCWLRNWPEILARHGAEGDTRNGLTRSRQAPRIAPVAAL
ncbi:alpha/beta hydrolase [Parahaliea maris]|uniref:Alpha/beta hydrolase n=1 Tax=Parahaliea maris TaxID=2716870 RepID=A0A5C9A7J9_9GAMM|nr:alpha/beta hydrolase [Parahaliea maris]TXS96718.1 alpha/beta hydrolase [Parahaliea maris]